MLTSIQNQKISGWWTQNDLLPETGNQAVKSALFQVARPLFLINIKGQLGVGIDGTTLFGNSISAESGSYPLCAYIPPLHPKDLGSHHFKKTHNLIYPYIAGAMANGITSVEMVQEMGRAGMLGFFGAAGLSLEKIEAAIDELQGSMNDHPFGFNLIHSPNEPENEMAVVQLYLKRGIRLVSAAAYMRLTLPIVYYRVRGIHTDTNGHIICPNKIIAKVSRVEVARKFFSPPPERMLAQLVDMNLITPEESALAPHIPMADDLTAEADSGGHTDNQSALSLLPTMLALRDEMAETYKFKTPLCVGLGGGIATPWSATAAYAMGAAYVLTGTVNQACVESGTSDTVRSMLAEADQADVTMAPAADMFQMGVKVQVLKRGTMFPIRASKLYELYTRHDSYENIPEKERNNLEKNFFKCSFDAEWEQTKHFFLKNDPSQVDRAEADSRHKMALVFRSYLGQSSNWATSGDPSRKIDYQVWCGPAIGAFNEWTKGTFLEKPKNRKVATVAMNLLMGASYMTRINWIHNQGVELPTELSRFAPMELSQIMRFLFEHES